MYAGLLTLGPALDTIPINDTTIGAATGNIVVDPNNLDIKAYYGVSSTMYNVRQWVHYYMDFVLQVFQDTVTGRVDTGYRFF